MAKKNGISDVSKAIKEVEKYTENQIQGMGKVIKKYSSKVSKDGKSLAPHRTDRLKKSINNK